MHGFVGVGVRGEIKSNLVPQNHFLEVTQFPVMLEMNFEEIAEVV